MSSVLFVCLGNICRSPLAEAIFDHKCNLKGLKQITSDSAGTGAYHIGQPPDRRSIQIARQNGVPINHSARQFSSEDCEKFDFIFAMDQANYRDIIEIAGCRPENLYLLREFDPRTDNNEDMNVPDPYYGGIDGFNKIYTMMSDAIENFIESELK